MRHPQLVEALTEQAAKLWHTSNLFRIPGQERLAERLVDATFADTVFFTNSGAEAIECGIKMARKYHDDTGHPERYRIIAFDGRVPRPHAGDASPPAARTKYLKGFGPLVDGLRPRRRSAISNELRAAIGPRPPAILVEPVQGEGGMRAGRRRLPARPARALRRVRPAAVLRRGPVRHGPHRQAVRP